MPYVLRAYHTNNLCIDFFTLSFAIFNPMPNVKYYFDDCEKKMSTNIVMKMRCSVFFLLRSNELFRVIKLR